MHYTEHLRRLTIDAEHLDDAPDHRTVPVLDAKTRSLVRLAALVAVAAAAPSLQREIDDAVAAGAEAPEIVAVLDEILPVVGRPRIVIAAPRVAAALGEDLDLIGD